MQKFVLALVRIIANTFFRRIDVAGEENIPQHGPVVFAGNHPNALMDGWLLTARCGRSPLHFLANAKLWNYRLMAPILDATGAVPVYRREEHEGDVDNRSAFDRLYEVIEDGNCVGIFPEGVSHAQSQLLKLKTGTARIALAVAARGETAVPIVPCGLNYIHRHRFRSQVLIEFGPPIVVDDSWARRYQDDEFEAARDLTEVLTEALRGVTLNTPDWRTLRFVQTARRLYKPRNARLSPSDYVELNRRFVDGYLSAKDEPEMLAFEKDIDDYQSRLDLLGIKDYQLRKSLTPGQLFGKMVRRLGKLLVLFPLAIPGMLLHLPVGWVAALVGERFSYEQDDVATLKVLSTTLLLPLVYLALGIWVGVQFGWWWSLAAIALLTFSFLASVRLIEAELSLMNSIASLWRMSRLGDELEDLRATRAGLVDRVRTLADRFAADDIPRMFTSEDFRPDAQPS